MLLKREEHTQKCLQAPGNLDSKLFQSDVLEGHKWTGSPFSRSLSSCGGYRHLTLIHSFT